ncbi:MAG: hypothetical protein CVV39_08550 [Planctomycetes bacterium HGW-Planctomycetes-1]|nr:MAG: hypothetical protein CVV39_08550 [Planctomycetes bacterium HGW-Planctomycetes-1]
MANTAIDIPFYVSRDGLPLSGAAAEMEFESLKTVDGTDKIASAPSISEIGGGWYKFSTAYGTEPFDSSDLIGVIDADKDANNNLANTERYIPVEVRLDFYALARSVYKMTQDKLTGNMEIKNSNDNTILKLDITDSESQVVREPDIN